MTLQDLFLFFGEHRQILILTMLATPWLTWLICAAIPGQREEPLILDLNLSLALVSLLGSVGYLAYATGTGGWPRVVREADLLLLLAPVYYVAVSLWVSRQRLPLANLHAFRVLQGLGLIAEEQ